MIASGDFYADSALVCASIFIFNGGWLLTLCGIGLSVALVVQGARPTGWLTLLLCLAPIAYIALWFTLAAAKWTPPLETSNSGTLLAVGGLLIAILCGPVAAVATFLRRNL